MKKNQVPRVIFAALTMCCSYSAQIIIPPGFFGGNWWFSNYTGAPFDNQDITPPDATAVSLFTATGATTMRAGGIAYTVRKSDEQDPDDRAFPLRAVSTESVPNPAGYVKLVDDIRAKGFEPHLTVPFDDRSKTRTIEEQALEAADIVRTVNKIHKRNVKVWIIANEPGPTQGYFSAPQEPTAHQQNRCGGTRGRSQCT